MSEWGALPFEEDDVPGPRRAPLTISELTAEIRGLVEGEFGKVTVEGEISNCRPASSGHIYFSLKDDYAQIRAVLFRKEAQQLKFRVEDGMHVIARGRVSVYAARGEYQIIVDALEPHGLGALQAAFEQLKRRLHAEGLFDQGRKRPLPVLPRRIGIVTSFDGAALRDMVRILTVRHPTACIVVRPARVQGEDAPAELIRGLRAIVKVPEIDVVIIGRGGGSVEDLWAFNDERLARAIAACPVPVVSAVGHETDFTIADFVADVRAATPSNAAEIVVDRADNFCARIERAEERLIAAMARATAARHQRAERLTYRLDQWPVRLELRERDRQDLAFRLDRAVTTSMSRATARCEGLRRRLDRRDIRRVIEELRTRTLRAEHQLRSLARDHRHSAERRIATLAGRLDALSPLAVLGRGYALCWNEPRTAIIRSSSTVKPGDRVRVTLAEGELGCRVEDSTPKQ